jgi:hypothetical protein
MEDFSFFLDIMEFSELFETIQKHENEFEIDKKIGIKFRKAYSKFFFILIISINQENYADLIKIFDSQGLEFYTLDD